MMAHNLMHTNAHAREYFRKVYNEIARRFEIQFIDDEFFFERYASVEHVCKTILRCFKSAMKSPPHRTRQLVKATDMVIQLQALLEAMRINGSAWREIRVISFHPTADDVVERVAKGSGPQASTMLAIFSVPSIRADVGFASLQQHETFALNAKDITSTVTFMQERSLLCPKEASILLDHVSRSPSLHGEM